jgi:hypothetical protein
MSNTTKEADTSGYTLTFTHKGWFGICPVYFKDLESEAPFVVPRHPILAPLLILSEAMYRLVFWCGQAMSHSFQPFWPLTVTGELSPPVVRSYVGREDGGEP